MENGWMDAFQMQRFIKSHKAIKLEHINTARAKRFTFCIIIRSVKFKK